MACADQLIGEFPVKKIRKTVGILSAAGHTLAQDIMATREQPPFDRVAMDGFAVKWSPHRKYTLKGRQMAGLPPLTLQDPIHSIEVGTGASLPKGTDTVIPYEHTIKNENGFTLREDQVVHKAQNIHLKKSDYGQGDLLLRRGIKLGGPHIAIIASQGLDKVQVFDYPQIAIISTGDELVEPGQPCKDWQIWRSNAQGIYGELINWGVPAEKMKLFHFSDNPQNLFSGLSSILNSSELIILSGGVSRGKFDFIPKILGDLCVRKIFHWIKQKPGRPLYFGRGDCNQAVFGLPGNPVSAIFCLRRYIVPFIQSSINEEIRPETAILEEDIPFKKEFVLFKAVRIEHDKEGKLSAFPLPSNGSGDFISLAQSSGFLELPAKNNIHKKGEPYPFFPWGGILP